MIIRKLALAVLLYIALCSFLMPAFVEAADQPPVTVDDLNKKSEEISKSRTTTVTTDKAPSETPEFVEETNTPADSSASQSVVVDPDERPAAEIGKQDSVSDSSDNSKTTAPTKELDQRKLIGSIIILLLLIAVLIVAKKKRRSN